MRMGVPHNFSHNMFQSPSAATLEHIVLTNSKQFYSNGVKYPGYHPGGNNGRGRATDKWKAAASKAGTNAVIQKKLNKLEGDDEFEEVNPKGCCNKKFCWWTPNQDSLTVAFCNETSIHGFKFMGQPKRHLSERIFWIISFLFSLTLCIYLIYGVWERYQNVPVIVSFQASEQDMDSLPFPAVTLCNMNKFPKSKVEQIKQIARRKYHPDNHKAKMQLKFIKSACNAQQSFAKEFHFAFHRGTGFDAENSTIDDDHQEELIDFLIEYTLPCEEMIRYCILGEMIRNCSDLFRPIITDYGKCCVFNILPLPMLLQNPETQGDANATYYNNPLLGSHAYDYWPQWEIKEWSKWNYEDGFVLAPNISKPWKQKRAGLPYGLSVLVDPNTEQYFCPVADSEGLRYILHTPLEMPHVNEFASVADLDKEILIEVHPDMTNADDDIRGIELKKRQCLFGKEQHLRFFGPYTGGNCIDECTAMIIGKRCKCASFYMPREDGVRICDNDMESRDYDCLEKVRVELQINLKDQCGHCETLCEDIAYNYETTIADLQNKKQLWFDQDPLHHGPNPPEWAHHRMSIIHVFFGAESTVPKYRKRLYGITDLIANTGGILGLCLGFSVLSGIEALYFLTLRSFWKYCRRRMIGRRVANKFMQMFKSNKNNSRFIHVNPNMVPLYPYHGYPINRNVQFYGSNFIPNMYGRAPPYRGY